MWKNKEGQSQSSRHVWNWQDELEGQFAVATGAALTLLVGYSERTYAASRMGTIVMTMMQPIMDLATAFSFPVCFLVMVSGFFQIMLGQRHQGVQLIKLAALGYIGMQLVPSLMMMVGNIGSSMKEAIEAAPLQ